MTMNEIHQGFARQGLTRPSEGRVLGGVVAGLGRRLGIAPWPARILFVLVLLLIPGSQLLIYPILWVLMAVRVHRHRSGVAHRLRSSVTAGRPGCGHHVRGDNLVLSRRSDGFDRPGVRQSPNGANVMKQQGPRAEASLTES